MFFRPPFPFLGIGKRQKVGKKTRGRKTVIYEIDKSIYLDSEYRQVPKEEGEVLVVLVTFYSDYLNPLKYLVTC